jgi:hypothetical protein
MILLFLKNSITYKYLLIVATGFLVFSCTEKEQSKYKRPLTTIELTDEALDKKTAPTTNYFEIIKTTPLQFSEAGIITGVGKMFKIADKFFFFDKNYSALKVFSNDGKFLYNIGTIGQGPSEFTKLFDVDYTESDSTFYLYCLNDGALLTFRPSGKFIKKQRVQFYGYYFARNNNKNYYYINYNSSEYNNSSNILVANNDNDVEHTWLPYEGKKDIPSFSFSGFLTKNNESHILTANAFADTVYEINKETIYPKYFLNFGKDNCPPEAIESNKMAKILPTCTYLNATFFESEKTVFFTLTRKREIIKCCWLKKQNLILTDKNFDKVSLFSLLSSHKFTNSDGSYSAFIYPETFFDLKEYKLGVFGSYYKPIIKLPI